MPITRSDKEAEFLQFVDETIIYAPRFFYKIYQGYGFSISHRFEDVAADASVNLYLGNPSGSGRKVYIITIDVIALAQCYVDIYRDNSITASGTSITPVNLNFEKTVLSVVNAEYGGTYTTGTLVHSTVVPGGSRIRAIGGVSEVGESVIISGGYDFIVKVTNKSASATDLSIRVVWWEE